MYIVLQSADLNHFGGRARGRLMSGKACICKITIKLNKKVHGGTYYGEEALCLLDHAKQTIFKMQQFNLRLH